MSNRASNLNTLELSEGLQKVKFTKVQADHLALVMFQREHEFLASKDDVDQLEKTLVQKIDQNSKTLRQEITSVEERLKYEIKELDNKIDSVEERLSHEIKTLDVKIDSVEDRLNSKIDGLEERLNSKIDSRFNVLDTKFSMLQWMIGGLGFGIFILLLNEFLN